jgi:ABC-type multidrug transport system fused ATPase/permease subunit
MTSDVDALQVLVEVGLIQLARALLTLLLLVVFLFGLSWKLTLAGLVLGSRRSWAPTGSRSSPKAGSANWARTRSWSGPAAAMPRCTPVGSGAHPSPLTMG